MGAAVLLAEKIERWKFGFREGVNAVLSWLGYFLREWEVLKLDNSMCLLAPPPHSHLHFSLLTMS